VVVFLNHAAPESRSRINFDRLMRTSTSYPDKPVERPKQRIGRSFMDKRTRTTSIETSNASLQPSTLTLKKPRSSNDILGPLLGEDGLHVKQLHDITISDSTLTPTVLANSIYQSNSIGIQIKRYRRPLLVGQVRGLMGADLCKA